VIAGCATSSEGKTSRKRQTPLWSIGRFEARRSRQRDFRLPASRFIWSALGNTTSSKLPQLAQFNPESATAVTAPQPTQRSKVSSTLETVGMENQAIRIAEDGVGRWLRRCCSADPIPSALRQFARRDEDKMNLERTPQGDQLPYERKVSRLCHLRDRRCNRFVARAWIRSGGLSQAGSSPQKPDYRKSEIRN